jgi:uncharacterized membrane protein YeiB
VPPAEPAVAAEAAPSAAAPVEDAAPEPPPPPPPPMQPIAATQRIEALDVVRGFALIGIFLMNIEFFNRTFASFNEGIPRGVTGIDWWATWFVNYLVAGKFWTIFSLLFGMGFAVFMVRSEEAGRDFKRVYLRRVLGLAVFGALHYIFIWQGDILFSYAIGALMLMVALYGRPLPLVLAIAAALGLGIGAELEGFFPVASGLATAGLVALYLRNERRLQFGRLRLGLPVFSLLLLLIGGGLCIAAVVFWLLPNGPTEPRLPLSVFGPLVFAAGWLSWKFFDPVDKRSLRLGAGLYLFAALAMTAGGVLQRFAPDPDAMPVASAAAATPAKAATATAAAAKLADTPADMASVPMPLPAPAAMASVPATPAVAAAPVDKASAGVGKQADAKTGKEGEKKAEKKPEKTKEQRAAERKAEREKRMAEGKQQKADELRTFTQGSYTDIVWWHASRFPEKVGGDFGFGVILMGMFLLGIWFVRSGVMENTREHLPLFRKLALYGTPLGIGLGLAGSAIAMSHTPGDRLDGWGIARGLIMLGNLPACLGYVSLVVLALNSNSVMSRIRVLAPMGRMALTNYLLQSLIMASTFYGYALGRWGMPRAQQLLFVAVVYTAQVAFSHWWLSKYRYGPMEWFWRGFTYRQVPAFRR